ncbi:S-methyl-5'-thioadenosine phosphorylase [Nerophis ophidion]|uniref:S-methyl-5'-thioadenosine phosphorylase n=1 Tax=Nerophis ophidion TaxID=159077 RepID=UPI002ADF7990|nr:S-methyl-5'-thioadenosine phosphorylase [Nerophis ophidion]
MRLSFRAFYFERDPHTQEDKCRWSSPSHKNCGSVWLNLFPTQCDIFLFPRNCTMSSPATIKIGIIGGSGLDDPDILEGRTERYVDTPYGKPSDALILGKIKNVECVLLARHGRQHTIMPSNINYQANIWALREEGCTHLLATTACGSLREEIQPGDIVIIDQFIDRTTKRAQTFYDGQPTSPPGVCHIPMAEPFCNRTREVLLEVARGLGVKCHVKGTMLSIEGSRFSSRAESLMFRQWGADVINMTTVPEVVLAKEAGLCYASIAMATDYDCWKEHEEAVSVDNVMKTMKENANKASSLLLTAIPQISQLDWTQTIASLKAMAQSAVMLPKH